jgi:endonuclease/exonuclease/phosphatase family metal-dependent hydrolase
VRQLAAFAAVLVIALLVGVTAVSVASGSPPARQPVNIYRVLQMNLCLSGTAACSPRTAYPSVVGEAAEQILDRHPQAVTLNEACSRDAADLARRTGYQMRFTAVLFRGASLPCVEPGRRGVFGLAVLTRDTISSWHGQAFATHAGPEERRWICATTAEPITVCTAHLGTRGSAEERIANDGECAELQGVLARYDKIATTVFGGDLNRREPCAPATMWTKQDTAAAQLPGIQHIYGSDSLNRPSGDVQPATYTDHDFFITASRLRG